MLLALVVGMVLTVLLVPTTNAQAYTGPNPLTPDVITEIQSWADNGPPASQPEAIKTKFGKWLPIVGKVVHRAGLAGLAAGAGWEIGSWLVQAPDAPVPATPTSGSWTTACTWFLKTATASNNEYHCTSNGLTSGTVVTTLDLPPKGYTVGDPAIAAQTIRYPPLGVQLRHYKWGTGACNTLTICPTAAANPGCTPTGNFPAVVLDGTFRTTSMRRLDTAPCNPAPAPPTRTFSGVQYKRTKDATATKKTGDDPAVPNLSGPVLDTGWESEAGDLLSEGEWDDLEEALNTAAQRATIPAPQPTETYQAYIARLENLGLVGSAQALSENASDPSKGPDVVTTTTPASGESVQLGSTVKVFHNAPTMPAVTAIDPATGGATGCDRPAIRAFDLTPLMVGLGDRFPFGIFGWLNGVLGGLVAGGVAPSIAIPMPGAIDDLVLDLDRFSPLMDWIHPMLLLLSFVSLVYLLASTLLGLGRPTED